MRRAREPTRQYSAQAVSVGSLPTSESVAPGLQDRPRIPMASADSAALSKHGPRSSQLTGSPTRRRSIPDCGDGEFAAQLPRSAMTDMNSAPQPFALNSSKNHLSTPRGEGKTAGEAGVNVRFLTVCLQERWVSSV